MPSVNTQYVLRAIKFDFGFAIIPDPTWALEMLDAVHMLPECTDTEACSEASKEQTARSEPIPVASLEKYLQLLKDILQLLNTAGLFGVDVEVDKHTIVELQNYLFKPLISNIVEEQAGKSRDLDRQLALLHERLINCINVLEALQRKNCLNRVNFFEILCLIRSNCNLLADPIRREVIAELLQKLQAAGALTAWHIRVIARHSNQAALLKAYDALSQCFSAQEQSIYLDQICEDFDDLPMLTEIIIYLRSQPEVGHTISAETIRLLKILIQKNPNSPSPAAQDGDDDLHALEILQYLANSELLNNQVLRALLAHNEHCHAGNSAELFARALVCLARVKEPIDAHTLADLKKILTTFPNQFRDSVRAWEILDKANLLNRTRLLLPLNDEPDEHTQTFFIPEIFFTSITSSIRVQNAYAQLIILLASSAEFVEILNKLFSTILPAIVKAAYAMRLGSASKDTARFVYQEKLTHAIKTFTLAIEILAEKKLLTSPRLEYLLQQPYLYSSAVVSMRKILSFDTLARVFAIEDQECLRTVAETLFYFSGHDLLCEESFMLITLSHDPIRVVCIVEALRTIGLMQPPHQKDLFFALSLCSDLSSLQQLLEIWLGRQISYDRAMRSVGSKTITLTLPNRPIKDLLLFFANKTDLNVVLEAVSILSLAALADPDIIYQQRELVADTQMLQRNLPLLKAMSSHKDILRQDTLATILTCKDADQVISTIDLLRQDKTLRIEDLLSAIFTDGLNKSRLPLLQSLAGMQLLTETNLKRVFACTDLARLADLSWAMQLLLEMGEPSLRAAIVSAVLSVPFPKETALIIWRLLDADILTMTELRDLRTLTSIQDLNRYYERQKQSAIAQSRPHHSALSLSLYHVSTAQQNDESLKVGIQAAALAWAMELLKLINCPGLDLVRQARLLEKNSQPKQLVIAIWYLKEMGALSFECLLVLCRVEVNFNLAALLNKLIDRKLLTAEYSSDLQQDFRELLQKSQWETYFNALFCLVELKLFDRRNLVLTRNPLLRKFLADCVSDKSIESLTDLKELDFDMLVALAGSKDFTQALTKLQQADLLNFVCVGFLLDACKQTGNAQQATSMSKDFCLATVEHLLEINRVINFSMTEEPYAKTARMQKCLSKIFAFLKGRENWQLLLNIIVGVIQDKPSRYWNGASIELALDHVKHELADLAQQQIQVIEPLKIAKQVTALLSVQQPTHKIQSKLFADFPDGTQSASIQDENRELVGFPMC